MLALALVAIAGIAATRLPWQSWRRSPTWDLVLASGLPLLLTGVLLGPGMEVLDRALLRALAPASALAIGWIGAVFGARLEWRLVRRVALVNWGVGTVRAVATFALVALTAWSLARLRPALTAAWAPTLPGVLTLGAVAVGAGGVARIAPGADIPPPPPGRLARPTLVAATLDTLLGAIAFTLTLALYHTRVPIAGAPLGVLRWLTLAGGSGLLVGMLSLSLARLRPGGRGGRDDLGLALLAGVMLGAGVSYAADLPPFVVCALAAVVIVNLSPPPSRHRVQELLEDWGRGIYAVLLIVVGALLTLPTLWLLVAGPLLAAVGIAAKWAGAWASRRWLRLSRWPADSGVGMPASATGAVALALALNFQLSYSGPEAGGLLTTVALGVLLTQLVAAPLLARARLTSPPRAPEVTG
jgi:hypothetical protein